MIDQIRNNRGESLAETLVASLIIGLAMIMLLSISQVTSGLSTKADSEWDSYYAKRNLYELLELEELNYSGYKTTTIQASLYDDGYLLGVENVVVYSNTRTVDGIEINYSYIE